MRFADGLSETPAGVSDALYLELAAVLNEAQLVELAATVAWENYRARFSRAFDLKAEGFADSDLCLVPATSGSAAIEVN